MELCEVAWLGEGGFEGVFETVDPNAEFDLEVPVYGERDG